MAIIIVLTVYCLFPIYWTVIASTKSTNELASTSGVWFSFPIHLVQNIRSLFSVDGGLFGRWMLNSVLYAAVGGVGCMLISGAAGYALAMLRFRGSRGASAIILVGTMLPATVLAFPQFLVLTNLGLVNTYWAVLLPSLISPFSVFLARMFAIQSVPRDLIEAARIDGAGEFRIARTLGATLMAPGLVTILLIHVVAIWNNFFLPLLVLNAADKLPATVGLYLWNGKVTQNPDYQSLVIIGSLVSAIPLIVLFLTLQRYWRSGLATGAVKA
ncbi:MAG TPA: carbohydrate ABC transporter permease [Pseudolysinimonas sp.]|nr:carbohydrate ABC transporter permease [Pseudolysinimonas sp.]